MQSPGFDESVAGETRKSTKKEGGSKKYQPEDHLTGFFILCNGQIQSGNFEGADNLYCNFEFTQGPDWRVVQGVHRGTSQVSKLGMNSGEEVVWNMPFDVTFKTTNPFGWPRLVVTVYGFDMMGNNIVRGYGSVLVPTTPGTYTKTVPMFAPVPSSMLQEVVAYLTGDRPEFWESSFVAQNKGREVTRVKSTGEVVVDLTVLSRGMSSQGFNAGGPLDSVVATDKLSFKKRGGQRKTPAIYGGDLGGPERTHSSHNLARQRTEDSAASGNLSRQRTEDSTASGLRTTESRTSRSSRRGRKMVQEVAHSDSDSDKGSAIAKSSKDQTKGAEGKDEETPVSTPNKQAFGITEVDQVGPGDAESESGRSRSRSRRERSGKSRSRFAD